jgi:Dihydropteroate synthase and related enzymes
MGSIFIRAGLHHVTQDVFSLFPALGIASDGPHAFYLGAELAKAEIAWRLGKRYIQDEPLDWGCAVERTVEDMTPLRERGHTLRAADRARKGDDNI